MNNNTLTRNELVTFLRDFAAFYEALPEDFPHPHELDSYKFISIYLDSKKAKEQLALIGSFEKRVSDDDIYGFKAIKKMGRINLYFNTDRENVCERKVVGTRTVPAQLIPESYTPSRVIEEHEEEIVEWDCKPILAPEQELANVAS